MKMKTVTMVTIDSEKLNNIINLSGDAKSSISAIILNKSNSYLSTCLKNSKMNYDEYKLLCNYLNIDESMCKISIEEKTIPEHLGNGRCKTKKYDQNINIDGNKLSNFLKDNLDISIKELSISLNRCPAYLSTCFYNNTISKKILKKICKQLNVPINMFTNKTIKNERKSESIFNAESKDQELDTCTKDISLTIKELYTRIDKTKQYKKLYLENLTEVKKLIKELDSQNNINLNDLTEDL